MKMEKHINMAAKATVKKYTFKDAKPGDYIRMACQGGEYSGWHICTANSIVSLDSGFIQQVTEPYENVIIEILRPGDKIEIVVNNREVIEYEDERVAALIKAKDILVKSKADGATIETLDEMIVDRLVYERNEY